MDEINLVYFNKVENKLEALAFYSGQHNCSKGEHFDIKDQDIIEIANNSNQWLEKRDLPIFTEHNKFSTNIKGVIKEPESFIARKIDESDVERNPKLKNLIGNMGLFLKNIELTDNVLLENIKKGVGKAVSVGVDLKNKVVHELSLVGLSALPQASIFNKDKNNITYFNLNNNKIKNNNSKKYKFKMNKKLNKFALTIDEALQENELDKQKKDDAQELLCVLLDVIEDIKETSDEELQEQSREDIYNQAMNDFMMKLDEIINPMQDMLQVNNPNNQQILQQNQPVQQNPNTPRMNTSYSNSTELNDFSVPFDIDTFDEMENYLSEYGLLSAGVGFVAKRLGQAKGLASSGLNAAKGAGNSGLGAIKNTATNAVKSVASTKLGGKVLGGATNALQTGIRKTANLAGNNGAFGIGKKLNKVNNVIGGARKKLGFKSSRKLTNFKNKGKLLNY